MAELGTDYDLPGRIHQALVKRYGPQEARPTPELKEVCLWCGRQIMEPTMTLHPEQRCSFCLTEWMEEQLEGMRVVTEADIGRAVAAILPERYNQGDVTFTYPDLGRVVVQVVAKPGDSVDALRIDLLLWLEVVQERLPMAVVVGIEAILELESRRV